jgi:hypothetical protein
MKNHEQQVAGKKQPATNNKPPAASNKRPATSIKHPATSIKHLRAAFSAMRLALSPLLSAPRPRPHALRSARFDTRGSALVLALVMVTVITTIIGAVLMGALLQWRLILKEKHRLQAFYLAEAGIQKALWHLSGNGGKNLFWRPENEVITLFDNHVATVSVTQWGGFLQVTSTASERRLTKSICVLVGEHPPSPFQQAVFIGGVDYPLVVTGTNRIVGDVTVGPEGVKKGRIKGRDFEGEKLVEGRITRQTRPQMPYFNAAILEVAFSKYLDALKNPSGSDANTFVEGGTLNLAKAGRLHIDGEAQINLSSPGEIIRGPGMISSSGNMIIGGHVQIAGYVELVAAGKIIVHEQARLENCILFAQQGIEASGRCEIEGQLFSPGDIVLKEQAALRYPSLLYCNGAETGQGQISLQDQSTVRGTIILFPEKNPNQTSRDETIVRIGKNAKVVGAVYSRNNTSQQGAVYGTVATGQFYLYESPTIYLNWLQDAVIDRSRLPENFLLPIGFSEQPKLEVLRWEEVKG